MNAKIQKICGDIEKLKAKISEFQVKLREMEKQKTELENTDIVEAVRGSDISLADLAAILKKSRAAASGNTTSDQVDPKSILENETDKEESSK